VQDGFMSNYLCDLHEGSTIAFQGPFGNFIMRSPVRDSIFIATGTGIAPFRSMLHELLTQRTGLSEPGTGSREPEAESREMEAVSSHEFWLLVGARYEQDIYYRDEFERLAAEHPNFHFLPTLSRGAPEWKGLRGYVQDHVKAIVGDRKDKDMHAYICGLDKMLRANRELLKSLGWERTSIRAEKYD